MRFVLLVVTASALLSLCRGEASGCFTVEGWKGEDGCSSRLFCDIGSRCSDKTGPMCKFGLYCSDVSSTCQPLKSLGANCSAGYDCASGICMQGPLDVTICADPSALPCGDYECGLGSYCRMEGDVPRCTSPRGGSSAPCDYEVMGCRGGLTCAPDNQEGATCTPIFSLRMGSTCANFTSQSDSGAEACELGTFCSGGICTPYEDVTGCSAATDCNYPMGYCKCFPEGARCVPFRNTACKESMDDLVQCMTSRNCNFDNDIEAWAFAAPTSCVALHCSAQYEAAACCLSQTSRGLEGSGSALQSPLGTSCGNSVVSGYLIAFIIVVVVGFFVIVGYILYRQFTKRAQSQYSQLSTVDPWDDDASQWGFEANGGDSASTELAPSNFGSKRAAFMRPDSF